VLPGLALVNAKMAEGERFDFGIYNDADGCSDCHSEVVDEWKGSAHAHSSMNNKVYRASFESFEAARADKTGFCGGCHDPALLLTGTLTDQGLRDADPRAHAGVSCAMCHGLSEPQPVGNGSYTLTTAPVPYPDDAVPGSLEAHRKRVKPSQLGSVRMCTSCHQGTLGPEIGNPNGLPGIGEPPTWAHSGWAGPSLDRVDEGGPVRTCVDCHMPTVPDGQGGVRRSHAFLGGHTVLAARRGSNALAALTKQLSKAVRLDIAAVRTDAQTWLPAETAMLKPGDRFEVDVVVSNVGVGHAFPGGARDMKDVWVELEVLDAKGRLLAEAGTEHARTGDDPTAHRLRTIVSDAEGRIVKAHAVENFRTVVANHTVGPRDAKVARYAVEVPRGLAADRLPLTLRARLRHRRYTLHMTRVAGTSAAPVVDLADVRRTLGQTTTGAETPLWRRLHNHGQALLHGNQEHLDAARPSLEKSLKAVPARDTRARAMVESQLARLEVLTHRVDEALARLERVETLVPGHPSVAWLRGELYAKVWRWPKAVEAFQAVAAKRRNATAVWDRLAAALGSVGDDKASLDAARTGLKLRPTHAGLLRSQFLALQRLERDPKTVAAAKNAWLRYRLEDDAHVHRSHCIAGDTLCRLEREPIHVHVTRPATGGVQ